MHHLCTHNHISFLHKINASRCPMEVFNLFIILSSLRSFYVKGLKSEKQRKWFQSTLSYLCKTEVILQVSNFVVIINIRITKASARMVEEKLEINFFSSLEFLPVSTFPTWIVPKALAECTTIFALWLGLDGIYKIIEVSKFLQNEIHRWYVT